MPCANRLQFEANGRMLAENRLSAAAAERIAVPQTNQRSQARSNVFLTAVLDSGMISSAIRIRNLSANGALIEASALPPVGTAVRVIRGELSARGTLAWADAGHAGISFSTRIDVTEWVKRMGHAGQQRVDGVVAALRSSEPAPLDRQGGASAKSVREISGALDKVCEDLAASATLSLQLGEQLLKLDSIAHALRTIANRSSS